ncbi:PASTA domain-containing protein [Mycolicibacterium mucogenicum]|uniref:PASTA domain-containing protein n=1 Tax=Mycolicibacterium mucogenicum TaxID=56689 RepID=UPI00226A60E2|nr:PASTA domain-containing protein [Mycolicibacterium mucogenicum]MCX8555751.1 PASTA domain-containing protein [Mycolicibacterium mucogenicum]
MKFLGIEWGGAMANSYGGIMDIFLRCTVALSVPLIALANPGTASAMPTVVGKTYAQAQQALSGANVKYEVSSTMGDELQRNDCVVVNQSLRPAQNFGRQNTPAKLLLSLDCTAAIASPGHPGNSAGSPEGRAAKNELAAEDWRQNTEDGQAWCVQNKEEHPKWDWSSIKGC